MRQVEVQLLYIPSQSKFEVCSARVNIEISEISGDRHSSSKLKQLEFFFNAAYSRSGSLSQETLNVLIFNIKVQVQGFSRENPCKLQPPS